MYSPSSPPATATAELFDALRRYAQDSTDPAATDAEAALLHLQRFATLGRLAAEVARDFGNLTTVMLGYCELLSAAAERGRPPNREYLCELRRAAERASGLTSRLIAYSRPVDDDPAPLDLAAAVGGLSPLLARLLGSAIRLVVAADSAAGTVLADRRQVEQVVINLLLNARDAITGSGGVVIAVDPVRLAEPRTHVLGTAPAGDYVRLRVADDGRGMGPETLAQLFRPFFTTKDGGIGLGLTVVGRVAQRAAAAVLVDSAVRRGTIVDVLFPRLEMSAAKTERNGHR
jgi:two-component system cell cycle sensor histidine kinase/response regulator CckA